MTVKKDPSGHRSVELQFDLPGTPEQVWQAIATGPGISAWFVPTDIEEREGGAVAFHLEPGMDSTGKVTAWQPPRRIAYEEPGWNGDAPPLATEFIIEARSGGTCKVRLVHSLFTSDDQWDDQLDSMESGWPPFFAVLRTYLTHFPGWRCASVRLSGHYRGDQADAWEQLLQALNLTGAVVGERRNVATADGTPSLAGIVERIDATPRHREVMLRFDQPAPGIALFGTYAWGGRVNVAISLFLYGDDAARIAAREEPSWQAWLAKRFPRIEEPAG